jgi:hypothetical protein
MISIHTITSTSQGKLHDNYDELCADALAQREFLIRVTGFAALCHALAKARKLLNIGHAAFYSTHHIASINHPVHRP